MKSSFVQLHTTVHASNLKRLQLCRLCSPTYSLGTLQEVTGALTYILIRLLHHSLSASSSAPVSPRPLIKLHPKWRDRGVQSAGESGETCVGARRGHALVSSPLFDSPHLRIGRRKCRISDVIRLVRWSLRSPFVCRRAL